MQENQTDTVTQTTSDQSINSMLHQASVDKYAPEKGYRCIYVRDSLGRPYALIISYLQPNGTVLVGWSQCCKADQFTKLDAKVIAVSRFREVEAVPLRTDVFNTPMNRALEFIVQRGSQAWDNITMDVTMFADMELDYRASSMAQAPSLTAHGTPAPSPTSPIMMRDATNKSASAVETSPTNFVMLVSIGVFFVAFVYMLAR